MSGTQAQTPLSASALATLRETPTGVIHDALGLLGLKGATVGIRPARGFEDAHIVGPALTTTYAPCRGAGAYPRTVYDVIYEAEPGQVLVVAGNGGEYAFSGDNQAHALKMHGFEALVIDGGSRDIAGIRQVGMPLFITAPTARVTVGYVDLVAVNEPVLLGGIRVNPGDIVVGDEDGVVIVPRDRVDEVLEKVAEVNRIEGEMEVAIEQRRPVAEVKALLAQKKPRPAK